MTLTKEEAVAALRALYRTEPYHNEAMAKAGKYVVCTGIVPDWLVEMTERTSRWYVRHGGNTYETTARSRADAVNNVRYNLYGRMPESECGAFDAINPAFIIMDAVGAVRRAAGRSMPRDLFGKVITKQDAMKRLRRMAG